MARSITSSRVTSFLRSDQIWMPSNSVPDAFHRGCPAVSVVSRCTWDSTKGGESKPAAGVYLARRRPVDTGCHAPDTPPGDADVNEVALQTGPAEDQVICSHT